MDTVFKNVKVVNDASEFGEMLLGDLLEAPDYFFEKIEVIDILETHEEDTLSKLCNKVRDGGKLVLSGVDGIDLCRRVYYGEISLQEVNENFFNRINRINSVINLKDFFLKNKEWKVDFAGVKDGRYLIEVSKHE